ncbi:helix-turn-helix transcriptional regulator [Adlercreutzia sp. ZJ473]|uniref:helix-turn-helix domain-containing protein n=1 Tax=Adlercreutzia sp. ZJ473 TaxID=2722822 RepID=UPI001555BC73|nr:helix-turn-helix transcriptional regulator [Adlercreutzia sp. ZJ473]
MSDPTLEPMLRRTLPFYAGTAITLGVLLVMTLRWRKHSEEQNGDIVLFMTLPCELAVTAAILSSSLDFVFVFSILAASNLTFLALIWIDMLYLSGRRAFVSSGAPAAAVLVVVFIFCLGMLVSAVLPGKVMTVVAPLGAVAYLVYLAFYLRNRKEGGPAFPVGNNDSTEAETDEPRLSYDEIRLVASRAMARDFGLSPKESEVLPLLITGISASAMGKQLFISHETVKTHKYHIYQKLGTHNFEETLEVFDRYANEAARGALLEVEEKQAGAA